ncbi:MAG: hypothetical protein Kow0070_31140 [Anaerolineales bacterium]
MTQGKPPPGTPRMAFAAPVYGRGTPTIELNSNNFDSSALAAGADPANRKAPRANTRVRVTSITFFISFLREWFGFNDLLVFTLNTPPRPLLDFDAQLFAAFVSFDAKLTITKTTVFYAPQ